MAQRKEYAVSDQNGYYVFYTDDYKEAKKVMRDIGLDLEEQGIEGSAAIMRLVDSTNEYELYF